jgi:hypothetical protein
MFSRKSLALCHYKGMQAKATVSSDTDKRQSHSPKFTKVLNGRKQPIGGLWSRNGRYYARLNVENALTWIKKNKRGPWWTRTASPFKQSHRPWDNSTTSKHSAGITSCRYLSARQNSRTVPSAKLKPFREGRGPRNRALSKRRKCIPVSHLKEHRATLRLHLY